MYLYLAAAVALSAAVAVRRLHDTGRSGWWLLVNLIPYVGGLISAVLLLLPVDAGENAYGAPPGLPVHSASVPSADTKRSSFWKVYFGLGVAATIYTALILGTALWDIIAVAVYAVALAGVFAYAWQKEVLSASFWRGFLPVLVVWTVAHEYILPISPQMAEAMSLGVLPRPLAATLNLIIDIPLFLAIYRQGLGRPALLS